MIKSLACAAALVLASSPLLCAAGDEVDPCTLIDKADLVKIFGEIKEGPKAKEGLMKEKQCEWTNTSGSWISVGVYSAGQWGLKKGSANNAVDLKDLGEEAFTDKRGTDKELYARKGKLMLEVRTSASGEVALQIAKTAVAKLP